MYNNLRYTVDLSHNIIIVLNSVQGNSK